MYKIKVLWGFLLLFPAGVMAAGDGIPVSFILFQALNFGIFLAIFIFFIKKRVPSLLKRKYQDFLEMSQKSKKLLAHAQNENQQIKEKINDIENQTAQVEKTIQDKIHSMEDQISKESERITKTLLEGAQNLLNREHIKLKQKLLMEVLDQIQHSCKEESSGVIRFLDKVQKRKVL